MDRLDLHVDVPALSFSELAAERPGESSARVRERVAAAHAAQLLRQGSSNAALPPARLRSGLRLPRAAVQLLERAVDVMGLSARAHDRVLRVALTLHDLERARAGDAATSWPVALCEAHVAEALGYRVVDRVPGPVVAPQAPLARRPGVPGSRRVP